MTNKSKHKPILCRPIRKTAQFMICMCLVSSMQIAGAQSAPCDSRDANLLQQQHDDFMKREKASIEADYDARSAALKNATDCFKKIKKLMDLLAVPSFPSLSANALKQIIDYLSNKACMVVVDKVQGTMAPVINTLGKVQGTINNGTNAVNGAVGGVLGSGAPTIVNQGSGNTLGGVVNSVSSGQAQTTVQNAYNNATDTAAKVSDTASGVWSRVGCAFGATCPP